MFFSFSFVGAIPLWMALWRLCVFSGLVIDTKATNLLVHGLNETVCTWKHAILDLQHRILGPLYLAHTRTLSHFSLSLFVR
jgi:hypothetical protein